MEIFIYFLQSPLYTPYFGFQLILWNFCSISFINGLKWVVSFLRRIELLLEMEGLKVSYVSFKFLEPDSNSLRFIQCKTLCRLVINGLFPILKGRMHGKFKWN